MLFIIYIPGIVERRFNEPLYNEVLGITNIIIQQIVTMPIYGKEALNIRHPYMTDILRYT